MSEKENEYHIDYRFIVKGTSYYEANRLLEKYLPESNDRIRYTLIRGRKVK